MTTEVCGNLTINSFNSNIFIFIIYQFIYFCLRRMLIIRESTVILLLVNGLLIWKCAFYFCVLLALSVEKNAWAVLKLISFRLKYFYLSSENLSYVFEFFLLFSDCIFRRIGFVVDSRVASEVHRESCAVRAGN